MMNPYHILGTLPSLPTIACTGHRDLGELEARVEADLSWTWQYPFPRLVVTGGAMGLDTVAAEVAQRRRENTRILSVVCRPFPDHEALFPELWKKRWLRTWQNADVQVTVCPGMSVAAYHARNRYVLGLAQQAVAKLGKGNGYVTTFWDGRRRGGTFATLQEARRMKLGIMNVHPEMKVAA